MRIYKSVDGINDPVASSFVHSLKLVGVSE